MSDAYPRVDGPRYVIRADDELYPPRVRDAAGHPDELYVIGNPEALSRPMVSIIGARRSTPYGEACAELAADVAVSMGIAVASGAAVGCDQAAQRRARAGGACVVAVLGSGADVSYPKGAAGLLRDIVASGGAVVSLQPWGSMPAKWAFVRRNAVIATLCEALVICEAGMPSGTFRTAEVAAEADREILVFPGPIFSPNSRGSNYLIETCADAIPIVDQEALEIAFSRIYGRLRAPAGPKGAQGATGGEDPLEERLLAALQSCPAKPAELMAAFRVDLPRLMALLGGLQVTGRVERLVDGRYGLSAAELLRQKTYDVGQH